MDFPDLPLIGNYCRPYLSLVGLNNFVIPKISYPVLLKLCSSAWLIEMKTKMFWNFLYDLQLKYFRFFIEYMKNFRSDYWRRKLDYWFWISLSIIPTCTFSILWSSVFDMSEDPEHVFFFFCQLGSWACDVVLVPYGDKFVWKIALPLDAIDHENVFLFWLKNVFNSPSAF